MLNLKFSKSLKVVVLGALFSTCSLSGAERRGQPNSWEEILQELSDLRHELKTAQVDFDILREKLQKTPARSSDKEDKSKVLLLEKKMTHLETSVDKLSQDVRSLNTLLTNVSKTVSVLQEDLSSQGKLLQDVSSLKGTLTNLSKVMSAPSPSAATYKVKAGDSLGAIAQKNKVSVEEIKKLNPSIKDDKIIIGQELKLSHAAP